MSTNAIETLQFNCTTCPSECLLTVEVKRGADGAVMAVRSATGNHCHFEMYYNNALISARNVFPDI